MQSNPKMDQNIILLVPTSIQNEQKCMAKPKESESTQQYKKKFTWT